MNEKNRLFTMGIISVLSGISIAIINKLIFVQALWKDALPKSNSYFYNWRFGTIYYTKQGQGRPLLLIHDLIPGSSDVEWRSMVSALSQTNTVYTLDLLGYGRSEKPNITYSNYLYVQLVTDFIKSIIKKRTDLIASGSSSSIAIMACVMDDTLFDRLMLVNPDSIQKTNRIPSRKSKALKLLIESPIVGTLIYNIMTSRTHLAQEFKEMYFSDPHLVTRQWVDSYYEAAHLDEANARYTLSSLVGNYMNFSIAHKLPEINNSIYVAGGMDEPNMKQTITEYTTLNAAIESSLINGSKHFPQAENPKDLIRLCHMFFH